MAEYREFAVELVVTTEHSYIVLARTPEEAVSLAEDLLDSGDEGNVTATSIDMADAASVDSAIPEDYLEAVEFEEESFE